LVICTLHDFSVHNHFMGSARFLPLQVAAVCYRKRGSSFEFLLVKTTSGDKWTFPKGATARRLSHSEAAEREALEEAGAVGVIDPEHFHLYLQPKGDTRLPDRVQEFVVKAFMLEVTRTQPPQEPNRNPTWFSVDDARRVLKRGREERHADELRTVIDRAVERLSTEGRIVRRYRPALTYRIWRSLLKVLKVRPR
jgi:8-oxo-dGTP pyrophosphatase MutT (NUDIX family)